MTPRRLYGLVIFSTLLLYACSKPKRRGPSNTMPPPPPLLPGTFHVWVHNEPLVAPTEAAALRIFKASGVRILVNAPGMLSASMPIFYSDSLCLESRFEGFYVKMGSAGFIMIGRQCSDPTTLPIILTHELLHALGVEHLVPPLTGLMLENGGDRLITADDLTALCSVRDCTAFVPETSP